MDALKQARTLDYHAAGEPLRIVVDGLPEVPGDTMLAKRRHMETELDHWRRMLMLEPRGHADMYGAVITEPVSGDADCGVLFMHNQGYSTMCGHGIIALATAAVEQGVFTYRDAADIRIDTPAGQVRAAVTERIGAPPQVTFENVPSFAFGDALMIDSSHGPLEARIAFGGAWYAYVDAVQTGLELQPRHAARLIALGREIKAGAGSATDIRHPAGNSDLDFLYGVIFTGPGQDAGHLRNVCIFADGELDRSPTGTGVSGLAALRHAEGVLGLDEDLVVESILRTTFTVRCLRETRLGDTPAVITSVSGSAHITGRHSFVLDELDPLAGGFMIR